ncbi:ParA family protein [Wenjunlia tyrosinilytica]|uniref:Uncharacterized protein n=1 Tax=Wenjunlia tyrosinilytica TaxID=1544741 RepID=A0A918E0Z2_9ACTN|nr:hypothetical protein [Wenjunlia tyrosinilytica]GGO98742.1 hypothetical protein GCM10012280_63590 [Wenjunlia tyrosinilytica]
MVDTSGGASFATYLPAGLYGSVKKDCKARNVSYSQGIARSVRLWLDSNPSPGRRPRGSPGPDGSSSGTRRPSTAQALAESEHRTLLIDYDPQGHLPKQLGHPLLDIEAPSLAKHLLADSQRWPVRQEPT